MPRPHRLPVGWRHSSQEIPAPGQSPPSQANIGPGGRASPESKSPATSKPKSIRHACHLLLGSSTNGLPPGVPASASAIGRSRSAHAVRHSWRSIVWVTISHVRSGCPIVTGIGCCPPPSWQPGIEATEGIGVTSAPALAEPAPAKTSAEASPSAPAKPASSSHSAHLLPFSVDGRPVISAKGLPHRCHLVDCTHRAHIQAGATFDAPPLADDSLFAPKADRPLGAELNAGAAAVASCTIYLKHISPASPVPLCDPFSSPSCRMQSQVAR